MSSPCQQLLIAYSSLSMDGGLSYFAFHWCDKDCDQKQFGEGRFSLACMSQSQSILEGRRQGRYPWQKKTDAEATRGCCLVSLLLRNPGTCPGVEPPTMNWDLSQQSFIRICHHRLAHRKSEGDVFSFEAPSSHMTELPSMSAHRLILLFGSCSGNHPVEVSWVQLVRREVSCTEGTISQQAP